MLKSDLYQIDAIRTDLTSSEEQRIAQLTGMTIYGFDEAAAKNLLAMSSTTWDMVSAKTIDVFEQIMGGTVREDMLAEHIENIPNLVGLDFTKDQTNLIARLVSPHIQANSLYSEELTTQRRQEAADAVKPVSRTFINGQIDHLSRRYRG